MNSYIDIINEVQIKSLEQIFESYRCMDRQMAYNHNALLISKCGAGNYTKCCLFEINNIIFKMGLN